MDSHSIERLDQLITKGEAVLRTHREPSPNVIGFPTLDHGAFTAWKSQAIVFLSECFGPKHLYVDGFGEGVAKGYRAHVNAGIGILRSAREDIERKVRQQCTAEQPAEVAGKTERTNKVFIVHGHDEAMKQHVARTLSALGLQPIILHEQANKGNTIIEKFEAGADVGFAVVLLSPDDKAFPASESARKAKPRARQNVIFELGYFIGKLSRKHVFALKRGENLEVPSDYQGVAYTDYDSAGHWRITLVRELRAAGYTVDANALID
jgi:predicted nucleotide-binding protein